MKNVETVSVYGNVAGNMLHVSMYTLCIVLMTVGTDIEVLGVSVTAG